MDNKQPEPSDLVDLDELMEIMDNDTELIKECFDDFISDSPEMLQKIKDAIDGNDAENLGKSAHALKGSLKYLAANTAADIAYQLEAMGSKGDTKLAEEPYHKLLT